MAREPRYPYLLVFNEKHGDRYYHITSREDYIAALRKIFEERLNAGYWYADMVPTVLEELPQPVDISTLSNDVVDLIGMDIEKKNIGLRSDLLRAKAHNAFCQLFDEAADGNDESLVSFMQTRSDYQYEEFRQEHYDTFEVPAVVS
jgi:hypothetical protein